jgi:hypothetical protein
MTRLSSRPCRRWSPESDSFERCVGFGWCTTRRFFSGNMVYVPRRKVLYDALARLPADERDRLRHSEAELIAYLDTLVRPAGPTRLDEQPPARS